MPAAPEVSFTVSPVRSRGPRVVQFADKSTGSPTTWSWKFGDGGTSIAQNPFHTYSSPGTYSVTLTATNTSGSNTTTRTVSATPRFPGDPGDGVILSGSSVRIDHSPGSDAADWLDGRTSGTKRHYLARIYGTGRTSGDLIDWTRIDQELAKGRLPLVSAQYWSWTPAQIADGQADAQLASDANNFKARAPQVIWFDYFHEPYDNFPCCTASAQFRAAYRHIVNYFRAAGVTNVAYYGPVSMVSWEYTPGGISDRGGEAYEDDPDWKGTKRCTVSDVPTPCAPDWYTGAQATVDILAFDQYSPASVGGSYSSFSAHYNAYRAKMNLWQRPWKPQIVPEIGTRSAPGTDWNAHWADVKSTMLANNIIGYAYFNSGPNSSFYSADPTGDDRLAAYNRFFNDPVVVGAP